MTNDAPHVSSERLSAALADPAFAAAPAGAPLIAALGTPPRIVHANAAALALFGADSLASLQARCLAGGGRLAELAETLRPGGPVRLERLRFDLGGRELAAIFMCRRTAEPEPLFVALAAQARAGAEPAPFIAAAATALHAPRVETPAAAQSASPRFTWRTDAAHRFVAIDEALTRALGWPREKLLGASFLEFAAQAGFDPQARLREALASRRTWSGVEARWPTADGAAAAPVMLGAAPLMERGKFAGFSGFGVIHLARLEARARLEQQAPAIEEAQPESPAPQADLAPESAPEPQRARFIAPNVVALDAWKTETSAKPAPAPAPEGETHESAGDQPARRPISDDELIELSAHERNAFREIARALGAAAEASERARAKNPSEDRAEERAKDRAEPKETRATASEDADAQASARKDAQASAHADAPLPAASERAQETPAPQGLAPQSLQPPAAASFAAALVDRIDVGLMVCREGEAVYLNRALLHALGYADDAAFAAAGGATHAFAGRSLAEAHGEDGLALRDSAGATRTFDARLKTIDWEGGPAILITFRAKEASEGESSLAMAGRLRALDAEARAYEAEAQELRSILDTATDGVAVLDETGAILSLNAAAEALFGCERRDVAGKSFLTLLARESHAAAQDYLAGLQSDGVRSVLNDGREVTGRAQQGGHIPMFMTIGRIGAPQDKRFCAVLRDLTQWKNAERELKDARREAERVSALKSDFLAKISHEVRTPLNAILGFAEVMMEERFGPLGSERYRDYLKDIHASGAHVMSLVNDLLDLSKIEAGRLDLTFGSVDANRIVSECVSLMQPQALRERVIMRLSLAPKLPNLVADERSLRQIVLNVLSNAVKFNQPGGQVIVSTALTDSGDAMLRVRDTGIGMSDREVETALEPFRQIETSRQTAGTGLGLPLTKALVEANRASFAIRSRKGEGTLVEIAFPSTRVLAE